MMKFKEYLQEKEDPRKIEKEANNIQAYLSDVKELRQELNQIREQDQSKLEARIQQFEQRGQT